MKRFVYLLLVMTATDVLAGDRPLGRSFSTRSEIVAQHGIAATSQPLATQVALDILKAGGNAIGTRGHVFSSIHGNVQSTSLLKAPATAPSPHWGQEGTP